jgi:hypothetical protein
MTHTVPVALSPEGHGVVVGTPTGSPTEIVRDVPAVLFDDYRRATGALAGARAAVVAAAGYDPDTAWDTLMDEQRDLLDRWLDTTEASDDAARAATGHTQSPGPSAAVRQAVELLHRVITLMASNAASAQQAGLAGDARRWRVVRHDVERSLELLTGDAPPPGR